MAQGSYYNKTTNTNVQFWKQKYMNYNAFFWWAWRLQYEKVIAWKQCVFVNIVAIGNHWSLSLVSGHFQGHQMKAIVRYISLPVITTSYKVLFWFEKHILF